MSMLDNSTKKLISLLTLKSTFNETKYIPVDIIEKYTASEWFSE